MSPVYFVKPGDETDGEPASGWYYFGADAPAGPFTTREQAYSAFNEWNAKRNAEAA